MAARKTPREVLMEFRRRRQNGLYAVAVELTNRAKVHATRHNDTGTRRNSITQTKHQDGSSVLWGIPTKSAPHAPFLELGFRPHWVPSKYIGLWMNRHKIGSRQTAIATLHGPTRRKRYVTRKTYKTVRAMAMGLYVGGPNSTLQSAPGGTYGYLFTKGGKRRRMHWRTKGGTSKHLTKGRVGHPILQPTAEQITQIPLTVYQRGFMAGGSRGR